MPIALHMTIWNAIYILWIAAGTLWIVTHKRHTFEAWCWIAFMFISPPVATLLYILINNRYTPVHPAPCNHCRTRLQKTIYAHCGSRPTPHNSVEALHNAGRTFAAIMRDLQRAKKQIDIEYYIISDDRIGRAMARILIRRARAGVRVRIIYDSLGSWTLKARSTEALRNAGIEVHAYAPLRFPYLTPSVHRRNHRKLIVIDGDTAYLGGINIASRYIDGGKMGFWRDEHVRIEGNAVAQAQAIFDADWLKVTDCKNDTHDTSAAKNTMVTPPTDANNEKIHSAVSLQPPHRSNVMVQIAWAEQGSTRHTIAAAINEALAAAQHNIRISTPYFLPPQTILDAICSAARSGVKVELIIPMTADVPLIGHATDFYIQECFDAGVTIYRYRNGFLHSKTIVIDDNITAVGSANMDYRSMRYNMEAVAFIYDHDTAADYVAKFYDDASLSEVVTAHWLASRSRAERLAQDFARLLAPIL